MKKLTFLLLFALTFALTLSAQDKANPTALDVIKKQGLENSQVMELAELMTDVYGPRLTGSPGLDKASEWAMKTMKEWGMQNVALDEWGPFGKGWELKHFQMHCEAPNYFPVIAYPKAWSPSTNGLVKGSVIYLNASTEQDLAKYKGQLKGKFVLLDTLRVLKEWETPLASRHDAESLLDLANAGTPTPRPFRNFNPSGRNFVRVLRDFLSSEQPLAIIDRNFKGDYGTVFSSGASAKEGSAYDDNAQVIPQVTMAAEHYNRIFRMLARGINVTLSMDLRVAFSNPDKMEHNIIAEIPGTDLKDQVVMFGGHYDSWHTATGATDNAAGSAVMMEVARIILQTIKETGIQPRRTLRLALWTGEEQGLYGSRGYVRKHLAETDQLGNLQNVKPEQEKISAYYNLDNGTGRIRGVYLQGNEQVAPIFREWLDPFRDMGATTLTLQNTGGTDHLSFHAVGIPGFQFIQDEVAYSNRTHHSNMDVFDHLVADDLKQASTIIAYFVWQTSQRNDMIPRRKMEPRTPREGQ
jgi:hypothetical protein